MTATLLQGDSLSVLATLPARSVQTCVTSPPYYGLRDYGTAAWEGGDAECDHTEVFRPQRGHNGRDFGDTRGGEDAKEATKIQYRETCAKCGAVRIDSQIGLEETPEAYIAKLVAVFREVRRVLADDGTIWVNIGDSYARTPEKGGSGTFNGRNGRGENYKGAGLGGAKEKDLLGIPWMLAFALRADGWYLRSEIIWHKPNPMPESVTDRPTKSHEQIFLLSKRATYYYDAEAVAEEITGNTIYRKAGAGPKYSATPTKGDGMPGSTLGKEPPEPLRNRRSVWTVTTQPYPDAHFATYPPKLIEPCILASTSAKGQCPECGKAWVRVLEVEDKPSAWKPGNPGALTVGKQYNKDHGEGARAKITTGWQPQCDHDREPVPQTVLDIFSGSGTTGEVALIHHRNYIGIELNPDYVRLSERRLAELQPTLFALPARTNGKHA